MTRGKAQEKLQTGNPSPDGPWSYSWNKPSQIARAKPCPSLIKESDELLHIFFCDHPF
jgi:hypothetical protein